MHRLVDGARVSPEAAAAFPAAPGPNGCFVRAVMVASADGAAEFAGRTAALGSPADRQLFAAHRRAADVILVGAGTVRAEGYGPARVSATGRQARLAAGQAPAPRIAVVAGRRRLDPGGPLFAMGAAAGDPYVSEPPTLTVLPLVLTAEETAAQLRHDLAGRAEVVVCGSDRVEPSRVLVELARRGLWRVSCEGGPNLLGQLAAAGLIDELCLTMSPVLTGGQRLRPVSGPPWPAPRHLRLVEVLTEDGVLFLRYACRS